MSNLKSHSSGDTRGHREFGPKVSRQSGSQHDIVFERLQRCAFEAIAEARKRINPNYRALPKEEKRAMVENAQDFLRVLVNEARSKGVDAGDKRTPAESRRMLDILAQMTSGKSLKQIVTAELQSRGLEPRPDYNDLLEKTVRSRSTSLNRFCKAVYKAGLDFLRYESGEDPRSIPDWYIGYIFKDWPGARFPEDTLAFREALRRRPE